MMSVAFLLVKLVQSLRHTGGEQSKKAPKPKKEKPPKPTKRPKEPKAPKPQKIKKTKEPTPEKTKKHGGLFGSRKERHPDDSEKKLSNKALSEMTDIMIEQKAQSRPAAPKKKSVRSCLKLSMPAQ